MQGNLGIQFWKKLSLLGCINLRYLNSLDAWPVLRRKDLFPMSSASLWLSCDVHFQLYLNSLWCITFLTWLFLLTNTHVDNLSVEFCLNQPFQPLTCRVRHWPWQTLIARAHLCLRGIGLNLLGNVNPCRAFLDGVVLWAQPSGPYTTCRVLRTNQNGQHALSSPIVSSDTTVLFLTPPASISTSQPRSTNRHSSRSWSRTLAPGGGVAAHNIAPQGSLSKVEARSCISAKALTLG